jgi:hypothetical protein
MPQIGDIVPHNADDPSAASSETGSAVPQAPIAPPIAPDVPNRVLLNSKTNQFEIPSDYEAAKTSGDYLFPAKLPGKDFAGDAIPVDSDPTGWERPSDQEVLQAQEARKPFYERFGDSLLSGDAAIVGSALPMGRRLLEHYGLPENKQQELADEHPDITTAGNILGSLTQGAVVGASTGGTGLATLAASGAAGGLTSYLDENDLGNIPYNAESAMFHTGVGAALGFGGGVALKGLGIVGSAAIKSLNIADNTLVKSFAKQVEKRFVPNDETISMMLGKPMSEVSAEEEEATIKELTLRAGAVRDASKEIVAMKTAEPGSEVTMSEGDWKDFFTEQLKDTNPEADPYQIDQEAFDLAKDKFKELHPGISALEEHADVTSPPSIGFGTAASIAAGGWVFGAPSKAAVAAGLKIGGDLILDYATGKPLGTLEKYAALKILGGKTANIITKGVNSLFSPTAINAATQEYDKNDPLDIFKDDQQKIQNLPSNPQGLLDSVQQPLKPVLDVAPLHGGQMAATAFRAAGVLKSALPVNPHPSPLGPSQDTWQPSPQQLYNFNQIKTAVLQPKEVFKSAANGTLSDDAWNAFKTVYPTLAQDYANQQMAYIIKHNDQPLTQNQKRVLKMTTSTQTPDITPAQIAMQQSIFAPQQNLGLPQNQSKPTQSGLNKLSFNETTATPTQQIGQRKNS